MDLAICTKRCTAMVLKIKLVAKDNLMGAEMVGDAILHREVIQPHDNMMEEMNKHYLREVSVREGADDAAALFLDDPDAAFYITNLFQGSSSI